MMVVRSWGEGAQQKEMAVYGQVQLGNANYKLREDNGTEVAKGNKDIITATLGGRIFFPIFWGFSVYTGPEISYTNINFQYPATYSNDETSPAKLNIGGVGGLSHTF